MGATLGAAVVGGAINAYSANRARSSSNRNSRRLIQEGREAAESVYFKPVGLTTSQGSVGFDDEGVAEVSLDPRLQRIQNNLYGGVNDLQSQVVGFDPSKLAADIANQQYSLMQPAIQQQQAGLAQTLFGSGRGGLAVAGSGAGAGGGGMVNPDIFGFNQAMAQQNAQIAADAQLQAFDRQAQLQGLLGSQLQNLGGVNAIESQILQQALSQEAQRSQQAAAAGGIRTGTAQAAAGIQGQGDRAFTNALSGLGTGIATAGVNRMFNKE